VSEGIWEDGTPLYELTGRGGIRSGPYVEWHRNGAVYIEGANELDVPHGRWRYRYEDGQMAADIGFRYGDWDGPWQRWYASGQLAEEGEYERGEKTGQWRYLNAEGEPQAGPAEGSP